ncbi:hypothetical protein VF21_05444 [Pseudogymnoascus sp. 05NY08]|nr:hypothetical protein VF21_05444 [Pseudogymnoascus sp. 05NY08]
MELWRRSSAIVADAKATAWKHSFLAACIRNVRTITFQSDEDLDQLHAKRYTINRWTTAATMVNSIVSGLWQVKSWGEKAVLVYEALAAHQQSNLLSSNQAVTDTFAGKQAAPKVLHYPVTDQDESPAPMEMLTMAASIVSPRSHTSNSYAFETQQPSAETHQNGPISTCYHQSETDQSYNIELSGYQSHNISTSSDIYFQTGHAVIQDGDPMIYAQGELDQRHSQMPSIPVPNNTQHPFDQVWQSSHTFPITRQPSDVFDDLWQSSILLPPDSFEDMWNISPSIQFSNSESNAYNGYHAPIRVNTESLS